MKFVLHNPQKQLFHSLRTDRDFLHLDPMPVASHNPQLNESALYTTMVDHQADDFHGVVVIPNDSDGDRVLFSRVFKLIRTKTKVN